MAKGNVVAAFTDRFGEQREIYREGPNGALKVKKNNDTVSHKMNRVAAVLIGQKIKAQRLRMGFELGELVIRAGLKAGANPKNRMWEIENAIRGEGLRMGTLFALAHALGCEAADLLPSVAEVAEAADIEVRAIPSLATGT